MKCKYCPLKTMKYGLHCSGYVNENGEPILTDIPQRSCLLIDKGYLNRINQSFMWQRDSRTGAKIGCYLEKCLITKMAKELKEQENGARK